MADRGYYKGEDIQACEDAGIEAYVARPQRGSAVHDGLFRKDEFTYDPMTDSFLCPGEQHLHPMYRSTSNGADRRHYVNRVARRDCAIRLQCTGNTHRNVTRWVGEAVLDRIEERLALRPDILDRRREIVEHLFGSIKQWMNQGAFLMRGLGKVHGEFSLTALAYNITRAINLVGVPGLLRAV